MPHYGTGVANFDASGNISSGGASSAAVTQTSTNASFYPTFVSGNTTGNYGLDVGTGLSFNPSTNIISTTGANLSGLTASYAVVTDSSKNLASLVYSASATDSSIVARDIYGNSYFTNVNSGSTTTVSAGQTIAMNAGNTQIQKVTGTSTVTFKLPDATTLIQGNTYLFNNNSTGNVTVQDASAGAVATMVAGAFLEVICADNSTTAGVWDSHWSMPSSAIYGTSGLTVTGNIYSNNNVAAGATTATAAGTTTLTVTSAAIQQFTGSTTQNVVLPSASTLTVGFQFQIYNRSTGNVTVKDGSSTNLQVMAGGTQATYTCLNIGTTAGTWDVAYSSAPVSAITALTGDGTATGPGSSAFTLATVNASPGTYTNASVTVNAKGLVTSASSGSAGFVNPMTTLGDIIYGGAAGAATRLAGNTTTPREFLTSAGISSAATAPTWSSLVSGDIPNNAANTSGNATTATTVTGSVPSAQVLGTTAGGNAPTGYIGEYVSANPGSPVTPAASGSYVTIASIS